MAGVILGGITGSYYPEIGLRVGFLGKLFINALKMIVLPLILVSITLSIMKVERLGSLGLRTFVYFISTTAIAVILGIVIVSLVHPGEGSAVLTGKMPEIIKGRENMSIVEILLLEFVSPNLFESAVEFNVLPLIVASILFGAAFAALGRSDAVFGPADDGGYWLIGLRRRPFLPRIDGPVRWSSPHALADTQRLLGPRVRTAMLETLIDVDDGESFARWRESAHARRRGRTYVS